MSQSDTLKEVYERLHTLLASLAKGLVVAEDEAGVYTLNTSKTDDQGRPVFFAMVKMGKGKVLFHLMPVYCYPELLADATETLKKRMQGKSCFNFKKIDETLFAELEALARSGLERFRTKGQA